METLLVFWIMIGVITFWITLDDVDKTLTEVLAGAVMWPVYFLFICVCVCIKQLKEHNERIH